MIWLVLLILVLWAVGVAGAVAGSLDAATQPRELWAMAGQRRVVWLWQAVFVLAVPVALVFSGIYFIRVRPRLVKADAKVNADADWTDRLRWYDRFNSTRRSPAKWAQAARLWWAWLVLVAVAAGILFQQLMMFDHQGSYGPSRGGLEWEVGVWAVLGLTSAGRAGFWYAEHMRLTGRRPARGGPLEPHSSGAGE